MQRFRMSGMLGFSVVWFGQVVSLLGSGMTQFALTIWAWQVTGEATALALVAFFGFFPRILLTPLAGALVDRWNRKLLMILSDLAAGLGTVAIFILYQLDLLQIWHLYAAAAFSGAFGSFQFPAYSASISLMLPKTQFTRANTMLGLARSISTVFAPMAAGALLVVLGIGGVMLIDIVTFSFAIVTLLLVVIPQPAEHHVSEARTRNLLADCVYGFRYIAASRSLIGLLVLYFILNLLLSSSGGVLSPMILARSGDSELTLATVMMIFGIAGIVGGGLVSIWGGPKRKIRALLLGVIVTSLFGNVILGAGREIVVWGIGAFLSMALIPLANGASHAIWQTKIPPHLQGRVFSARILIGQIGGAVALPLSGVLADRVFEPFMAGPSAVAQALSRLVGSGPGSGMGLMFVTFGILGFLAGVGGFLYRPVRNIESILPDYDAIDQVVASDSTEIS
jgi:DHA3 family macrolide efflux protein-like MFS transporter